MCQLRRPGHHCGLLGYVPARHRLPVDRHHRPQTRGLHFPGNVVLTRTKTLFWDKVKRFLTAFLLRQIIINPNYEVPETDYSNNILKCRCRYDGHRVWMYSCHNGTTLWNTAERHQLHAALQFSIIEIREAVNSVCVLTGGAFKQFATGQESLGHMTWKLCNGRKSIFYDSKIITVKIFLLQ